MAKGLIHGKQLRDRSISSDKLNFDLNGGSINYNGDYDLRVSSDIIGDNQSTNLSPSEQPVSNTAFYVLVNGVQIKIGNGNTQSACYFSDDNTNAINIKDIGTQSTLFWNSSIANYILTEEDRITFKYQISSTFSASDLDLDYNFLLDRSNHTGVQSSDTIYNFNYIHEQSISSNEWYIEHNLNRFPSVTVVDSADNQYEGSVTYLNQNEIIIEFNAPFTGKAFLT